VEYLGTHMSNTNENFPTKNDIENRSPEAIRCGLAAITAFSGSISIAAKAMSTGGVATLSRFGRIRSVVETIDPDAYTENLEAIQNLVGNIAAKSFDMGIQEASSKAIESEAQTP
jgi:hypothetical protein